MEAQATAKILRHMHQIPDFRRHNRIHKLSDVITIAIFAVICGAEGWVEVEQYGRKKLAWLKTFLDLPNGIPAHDTLGRVFARLKPEEFERCFMAWMATRVELSGGKLVAIDGKSLRRSFEQGWDKSGMAHMVSAFVAENKMVFAQVKTVGKGQELDGIQRLLKLLDIQGAVVTIDALGCNKTIVELIWEGKADYLLQVKDNQPTLHAKVQLLMDEMILENFAGIEHDDYEQTDGDHGRIETRRVWVAWNVKDLGTDRPGVAGAQEPGGGGEHPRGGWAQERGATLLHQFAGPADQGQTHGRIYSRTLDGGEQRAMASGHQFQ